MHLFSQHKVQQRAVRNSVITYDGDIPRQYGIDFVVFVPLTLWELITFSLTFFNNPLKMFVKIVI